MSVADRFEKLIGWLEPTQSELEIIGDHRHTVSRRLESSFSLAGGVVTIGSFSRGSAIHSQSDLDIMPVIDRSEARWGGELTTSNTVMKRVSDELHRRFAGRTNLGKDGQAVVIDFADGHSIDVVPALPMPRTRIGGDPAFLVPNGRGGWMKTSPPAHNRYIGEANRASGGKLRFVAMLIKFWRTCRTPNVALSSFHVELLLAESRICIGAKSYAQCLFEAFNLLAERECRALRDPLGISGLIQAAATEAKQQAAVGTVIASYNQALAALQAERSRNTPEAYRQWKLVFRDQFPSS